MENPSVYFNDTKQAFAFLDDAELKMHHRLFSLMANPYLVKIGNMGAKAALKMKLPIDNMVRKTLYKVFVGGETLEDCQSVIEAFRPFNVGIVPDYSIEAQEKVEDFEHVTEQVIRSVDFCKKNKDLAPFTVFKMTALARFNLLEKLHAGDALSPQEDAEYEALKDRVERIARATYEAGISVFFDAEETWIQKPIDDLAHMMMEKYNQDRCTVYNTYQMYRKDGLQRIKNAHIKAAAGGYYFGAKLVRGAYMNKERKRAKERGYPSPIADSKEATDDIYNQGLSYCINEKRRIWLVSATHNEVSCAYLIGLMDRHGLKPGDQHVYFSQLYGMSNNLTFNLTQSGYNAVKYLPYGPIKHTVPYLIRRAEENASAFGQSNREMLLLKTEMTRRGLSA